MSQNDLPMVHKKLSQMQCNEEQEVMYQST